MTSNLSDIVQQCAIVQCYILSAKCECMLEQSFQTLGLETEEKGGFCWFGNVSANPVFNKSISVFFWKKITQLQMISLVFTRSFTSSNVAGRGACVNLWKTFPFIFSLSLKVQIFKCSSSSSSRTKATVSIFAQQLPSLSPSSRLFNQSAHYLGPVTIIILSFHLSLIFFSD